ncbi:uncharacterized protein CDV56_102484 [Aspergillus thermomutatus]|uniref:Ketoreductase (KR) domain-containing protein n=1 Tax=Aspergillus thermomutatus TaxID=41047 RepID=A0A397HDX4_ASPTH|nr:uncharacterized protein CDV56_102484 [Aspergillus thermomutatus]RHZ59784.1 hypothetical protein CDV56_102484 [Aspergillus thermomutatus]
MPTYVVTGAARGLGYAFIKLLASDPANTVIGLVRNSTTARARLAPDSITNVHVIPADITDKVAMKRAAEESREVLDGKGLDVLICNAAYISEVSALKSVQEFEQDTLTLFDDAEKSFNVNVLGTLKTVFAFLPLIQEGQLKKVVATSSGMGDIDLINEAKISNVVPYALSKAALRTLFAKLAAAYEE